MLNELCGRVGRFVSAGPGLRWMVVALLSKTSDWLIHPTAFPEIPLFYQSEQECEAVQRNLALVRPGGPHWCAQCARQRAIC